MTPELSRDRLRADLQGFAKELGTTPTAAEMTDRGPHSVRAYRDEFGSWNEAVEAAGLEPNSSPTVARADVLRDIARVAKQVDKAPSIKEMCHRGRYSRRTYVSQAGSYVELLEEAGLIPSRKQYAMSDLDPPPGFRSRLIAFLSETGPTPSSDLPYEPTIADRAEGATKFTVRNGKRSGSEDPVWYLYDEHEPRAVLRAFVRANPDILEDRNRKGIQADVGNYGRAWSDALRVVLNEVELV